MYFENLHEIMPYLAMAGIVIILIVQVYYQSKNEKLVNTLLSEYYRKQGIEVTHIAQLTITEKLKYGVSVSPFIKLYQFGFTMFSNTADAFYKKVETETSDKSEQIRYIEFYITKGEISSCEEFDVYQF